MLTIIKQELDTLHALNPGINELIGNISKAIAFTTVPEKMKAVIAVSHISNFAGQFRRRIELQDGTLVPINAISFVVSGSGQYKDASNNAVKRCFDPGFKLINAFNEQRAVKRAIAAAKSDGQELPENPEVYGKYIKPMAPLFTAITTPQGLVQNINDVSDMTIGSHMSYTGKLCPSS